MLRVRLVTVAVLTVGIMPWAKTVYAQDFTPQRVDFLHHDDAPSFVLSPSLVSFRSIAPEPQTPRVPRPIIVAPPPMAPVVPDRPMPGGKSLLNSLYATTIVMQALDVHSTLQAIANGAVEANPLMSKVAGNPAALIATKAAVSAVSIWAAHKMSKKNRAAAVITLVAVNSAYAMIVSHNYRLAR